MQELIDRLEQWNSPEFQATLEGHGTRVPAANAAFEVLEDVTTMVAILAKAWASIGALCNEQALDEDDAKEQIEYIQGISAMAHKILRQIAAAEHAVQERS